MIEKGEKIYELENGKSFSPTGHIFNLKIMITCILEAMASLSVKSSDMFLVPRTFLRVVDARRRVDWYASETFTVAMVASKILIKITASTATVTESLVRI